MTTGRDDSARSVSARPDVGARRRHHQPSSPLVSPVEKSRSPYVVHFHTDSHTDSRVARRAISQRRAVIGQSRFLAKRGMMCHRDAAVVRHCERASDASPHIVA
eukprot:31157-Pelagococcus_subviridis.AAC.24